MSPTTSLRATLFLVAMATGLRTSELVTLIPEVPLCQELNEFLSASLALHAWSFWPSGSGTPANPHTL